MSSDFGRLVILSGHSRSLTEEVRLDALNVTEILTV